MGAAQLPLDIEQGSDFVFTVTVSGGPASLTGFTGAMQIREQKSDAIVLYEADSADITFDVGNRIVTVRIPYEETADFDWDLGVYDVLITSADEAWRIAEGKVTIDHWVTREGA